MSETDPQEVPKPRPANPRRLARERAVQAVYTWLLNPASATEIKRDARIEEGFTKLDARLFDRLIDGVTGDVDGLRALLTPLLDRPVVELSPVEHAILLLGALELSAHIDTPYRVVINEAIDLAKTFGGTDGHRYINGVLDRLAAQVRPDEAVRR
jgi:N utilization substance protein B